MSTAAIPFAAAVPNRSEGAAVPDVMLLSDPWFVQSTVTRSTDAPEQRDLGYLRLRTPTIVSRACPVLAVDRITVAYDPRRRTPRRTLPWRPPVVLYIAQPAASDEAEISVCGTMEFRAIDGADVWTGECRFRPDEQTTDAARGRFFRGADERLHPVFDGRTEGLALGVAAVRSGRVGDVTVYYVPLRPEIVPPA